MGLFRRGNAAPPLAPEREVIVVGTEHYPVARTLKVGPVAGVTVEHDKGNKHDRNAVAVHVNGELAGYLSRAQAQRYRPLLTGRHPVAAHAKRGVVNNPALDLFVKLPR